MDLLVRAGTLTSGIRALDLRAMPNKKSGGGNPNAQNQTVAEASHLELDFQVHREETAAQLVPMAEFRKTVSSIKAELLAEMRLLLLETRPVQTATVPDLVPGVDSSTEAAQISFGNLQEVADVMTLPTKETPALPAIVATSSELTLATANPKGPVTTSTTTVAAANVDSATKGSSSKLMPLVSEPNIYRALSHHEVILGVNNEVNTATDKIVKSPSGNTVVGGTRAVECVRPNVDVNFGKRADSGGGSNSMPGCGVDLSKNFEVVSGSRNLDSVTGGRNVEGTNGGRNFGSVNNGRNFEGSTGGRNFESGGGNPTTQTSHYYQHINFGTNPFNYSIGPCPATHLNTNQAMMGFAPTTHVNTMDPSLIQLPSFYHTLPYLPYTPIQPYPTSNFSQPLLPNTYTHTLSGNIQPYPTSNFSQPLLPNTYTHTLSGNQIYPPHPNFGSQSANGAWLHGHNSPNSNMTTQVAYQVHSPNMQQGNGVDPSLLTMRQMGLEFPNFSGGDPVEWLNKAEQIFEFYQVPEDGKLAIGTMHLVEEASVRWYMFKHKFAQNWQGLKDLLMREFGAYHASDHQAALARMSQVGTVDSYMEQVTKLSRRAPGFSQQTLLSLCEAKEQSHKAVQRSQQQPGVNHIPTNNFTNNFQKSSTPHSGQQVRPQLHTRPVGPLGMGGANGNANGSRRLSQAGYQEHKARNQCSFCEELFKPGHNCRKGQGQLMVMEVLQEEEEEVTETALETVARELHEEEPETEIVLNGASHNFIHPTLLKRCKATVKDIKPLRVRLASGAIIQTRRLATVELQMNKFVFTTAMESVDQQLRARDDLLAVLKRNLQVTERVGKVAYRLELLATAKIHNVSHHSHACVSLLKKKVGEAVYISPELPPLLDPANPKWEPVNILKRRIYKKQGAAGTQWLIQWLGTSAEEATGKDAEMIKARFPDFDHARCIG